jgi:hypothetical protein
MNLIYGANFGKEMFVANMQQFINYEENPGRSQNRMD